MNFMIVAALMVVAVQAAPGAFIRYALPTQSQYHAQDELGQYSFGHQEPNQMRAETKDAYGVVRGSYSYASANGNIITNNYIADENGFRSSLAPSNGPLLPVTGKLPKVAVSAPVHLAAPIVKVVEQPTIVKTVGAHAAPAPLAYSYGHPYGYAAYGVPYGSYASPYSYSTLL